MPPDYPSQTAASLPGMPGGYQGGSMFAQGPVLQGGPLDLGMILGQGPPSQAMNMLTSQYVHNFILSRGMAVGQFQPMQNLMDQEQARRLLLTQREAMVRASTADEAQMQRQLRNVFSMFQPGPITASQNQLIGQMAASGMKLLPYVAPFAPGAIDQLFGVRGSASLMAMGFAQGSRLLTDERGVTGGMTGQHIGQLSEDVFKRLYGPGQDVRLMRGMGGASAGQLFTELSQRGLLGDVDEETRERFRRQPASQAQLQAGAPTLRQFQADRVAGRLKEMAGAVAAMRDIFGDMGHPDAPLPELIQGLEALTQGGLGRMERSRVEMLLRNTQQMAKLAGVSMQNVMAMQEGAGRLADTLGVSRLVVPEIVTSSMAFATAYGQTAGATPSFNKFSKEQMLALDQRLRVQAASSDLGNQIGAIARLGEQGLLKGEALQYYEDIKRGNADSVRYLQPGKFIELLTKSGIGDAAGALANVAANQEFLQRAGGVDLVRRVQGRLEAQSSVRFGLEQTGLKLLGSQGMASDQVTKLSSRLAELGNQALFAMDEKDLADNNRRRNVLAQQIKTRLTPEELRVLGPKADNLLQQFAAGGWADLQQLVSSTDSLRNLYGEGGIINLVGAHSDTVHRRSEVLAAQVRSRAAQAKVLAGLSVGPVRGLMDELMAGKKDLGELAARFLGGVNREDIVRQLEIPLKSLGQNYQSLQSIQQQMETLAADTTLSADEKKKRMDKLRQQQQTLEATLSEQVHGANFTEASNMAGRMGVSLDELLRGRRASGAAIPSDVVSQARRMAGAQALAGALGVTSESGERLRRHRLDQIRQLAAPNRADVLKKMETAREEIARVAAPGLDPSQVPAETIDKMIRAAQAGRSSGKDLKVLEALRPLGSRMAEMLGQSGLSLDEATQAVRGDRAREQEMNVRGELRIIDGNRERRARVQARGSLNPGGAPT